MREGAGARCAGEARRRWASHLELLLQLLDRLSAARDGRRGAAGGGAVDEVLLPVLDGGGLLAVEPELGEGLARGAEQLGYHIGGVEDVLVRGIVGEGGGRRHDVAVDVAAAAESGGARVGNGGDDGFEVVLLHAMDLSRVLLLLRSIEKYDEEIRMNIPGTLGGWLP